MPELTCAFMRSAPHQTYPQRELPQNFFGNSGGPRPRESLMRCAIPKNGYFFGSDQIPDDFANSLEDLILLHRVNQSRARRMEALQKKMLTLQLFAQGKLLGPTAQRIERYAAYSRCGAFLALDSPTLFFLTVAGHFLVVASCMSL